MRWRTDHLADVNKRDWTPAAPVYLTALWLVRQWDHKRERFRQELHPLPVKGPSDG